MIADFTAAGVQLGCAWITSAAVPDTNGVAINVPDITTPWLPLATSVDVTASPGAEMSGLSRSSVMRGPLDEKVDVPVWMGVPLEIEIDTPSRATSLLPSEFGFDNSPRAPKNGMVTTKFSPVSGFCVICPSKGGRPAVLLIITTAAGRACVA